MTLGVTILVEIYKFYTQEVKAFAQHFVLHAEWQRETTVDQVNVNVVRRSTIDTVRLLDFKAISVERRSAI